jgi:hypothetical protein
MVALTVVANQQKGKKPLHALSMLRKVCNDFENFVHGYLGGKYPDVESENDCECVNLTTTFFVSRCVI